MKTAAKVWLIVGSALFLAGAVAFVTLMTVLEWDFRKLKLSTRTYETRTHVVEEVFEDLSITTDTANICLLPSEDGTTSVVCYEETKGQHKVEVRDGTLFIEIDDTREWYDYVQVGVNFESPWSRVYLPQETYGALTVQGDTCDVESPSDFQVQTADIALSTGDVKYGATTENSLKIKTTTGHIRVEELSARSLDLKASTGHITATGVKVAEEVSVSVSTGKVNLSDLTCKSLTSTGNTGDLTMKNVIAEGKMLLTRSTGDVKWEACDAAEISVTTDTGDVTGSLLSEKIFYTKTDTGDVEVPRSTTGGICEITTDTGDIRVSIAEN